MRYGKTAIARGAGVTLGEGSSILENTEEPSFGDCLMNPFLEVFSEPSAAPGGCPLSPESEMG